MQLKTKRFTYWGKEVHKPGFATLGDRMWEVIRPKNTGWSFSTFLCERNKVMRCVTP